MHVKDHWSLQRVADHANGYPLLVRRLCEDKEIPLVERGRFTYVAETDIPEIVWLVDQWLRRPRMTRPRGKTKPRRAKSRVRTEQVVLSVEPVADPFAEVLLPL